MYNVILADPPWSYDNKKTGGSLKSGAASKYVTMSLDEICNLRIKEISDPNSLLFLWVTNSMILSHAPKVLEAWGFTYRALFTWEKDAWGLGYWFRNCTEQLLVASRGKVKPFRLQRKNILKTKRLRHSQKPGEVRLLVDEAATKSFPGYDQKIELFARQQTPGWDSWGLDVDGVSVQDQIDRWINPTTQVAHKNDSNDLLTSEVI